MRKENIFTIVVLTGVTVALLAGAVVLPYKGLLSALTGISVLGLLGYLVFGNIGKEREKKGRQKYSDILIVEDLDRFFSQKKPYLSPDFKISDLEKKLKVNRKEIYAFIKKRFGINFIQFLDLWRIAEVKRLLPLTENENVSLNKLCKQAGFRNAHQYHQAEKERKARNRKKKKKVAPKDDDDLIGELDFKKKPGIQIRV